MWIINPAFCTFFIKFVNLIRMLNTLLKCSCWLRYERKYKTSTSFHFVYLNFSLLCNTALVKYGTLSFKFSLSSFGDTFSFWITLIVGDILSASVSLKIRQRMQYNQTLLTRLTTRENLAPSDVCHLHQ